MKPALHVVRPQKPETKPYDEHKGRKRIGFLRAQLMAASVRYVLEGTEGSQNDRLREASNLSGIPLVLIESELKRQG